MPGKRNFMSDLIDKVRGKVSGFLYDDRGRGYGSGAVGLDPDDPPYDIEEPPRRSKRGRRTQDAGGDIPDQRSDVRQPQVQMPYTQRGGYQMPYGQNRPMYDQQAYAQQPYAQQPYTAQQPDAMHTQFAVQVQEQEKRGFNDPNAEAESKVVNFPRQFQGQQADGEKMNLCIVQLRNMGNCREAINHLRRGCIVSVIMEAVQDQSEMRRYVDMLSGACFSLSASITKMSRYGSYILAPGSVSVMVDNVTSQMNGSARRPAAQQPARPQRGEQPTDPYGAYQPSYQDPTGGMGYERRVPVAQPEESRYYYRQPLETGEPAPLEARQAATGYVPDAM